MTTRVIFLFRRPCEGRGIVEKSCPVLLKLEKETRRGRSRTIAGGGE